jgi:hypothetical protein
LKKDVVDAPYVAHRPHMTKTPTASQIAMVKAAAEKASFPMTAKQMAEAAVRILANVEPEDREEDGAFYDAAKEFFTK